MVPYLFLKDKNIFFEMAGKFDVASHFYHAQKSKNGWLPTGGWYKHKITNYINTTPRSYEFNTYKISFLGA